MIFISRKRFEEEVCKRIYEQEKLEYMNRRINSLEDEIYKLKIEFDKFRYNNALNAFKSETLVTDLKKKEGDLNDI